MAQRRPALRVALGVGVAALAVAIAYVVTKPFTTADLDSASTRKRALNLALQASAQALPGTPDLQQLSQRLTAAGLALGAPVFVRIFKQEFELEVWLKRDGRFERFAVYPVCNWSGRLGPKVREGDRQAPEGFYTVDSKSLNPNSRWHRSFNLGFPNAYDRAHGRTGSFLMVHGGCSSVGCFAMTDPVIDEIWQIVTAALGAGQKRFQVHVFPFRMTPSALAAAEQHPQVAFWRTLQPAFDAFEASGQPPEIVVCHNRYKVNAGGRQLPAASDAPLSAACAS